MFLHYLTLHYTKVKHDVDDWHLGPYSSGHHWQNHWPVANTAGCMCEGKGTSLQTPTVFFGVWSGSFQSHFRHQNRFCSEALHIETKTT